MDQKILGLFIPILAIVMGCGTGMLALWLDYRKKARMFELHHKERLLALERGIDLPPLPAEFFQAQSAGSRGQAALLWGLLFTLVGMAFAAANVINGDTDNAAWALVPIAVGSAQLIYYMVIYKGKKDVTVKL